MKISKIINFTFLLILLISLKPAKVMASSNLSGTTVINNINKKHADSLINRLNEIKSIDKSNLTSMEKLILRKEVKSIHRELVKGSGGIYLSVGAILLIILLLIILI